MDVAKVAAEAGAQTQDFGETMEKDGHKDVPVKLLQNRDV